MDGLNEGCGIIKAPNDILHVIQGKMTKLLFLTGGSRGFGRSFCLQFSKAYHDSIVVITGRDQEGLDETKRAISAIHGQPHVYSARVVTIAMDLADLASIENSYRTAIQKVREVMEEHQIRAFDQVLLANNAGSLGELRFVQDLQDVGKLRQTIDVNVTSTIWLTSLFIKSLRDSSLPLQDAHETSTFGQSSISENQTLSPSVLIVNISSLCAIQPFPSWATYCVGKAARDMFHLCLDAELNADPSSTAPQHRFPYSAKTLNYAPGPLDTQMQLEIRSADEGMHQPLREQFLAASSEGKLIHPDDSALKLLLILQENTYTSGSHIDYYDV